MQTYFAFSTLEQANQFEEKERRRLRGRTRLGNIWLRKAQSDWGVGEIGLG
jgi:hypothetical protein